MPVLFAQMLAKQRRGELKQMKRLNTLSLLDLAFCICEFDYVHFTSKRATIAIFAPFTTSNEIEMKNTCPPNCICIHAYE